MTPYFQQDGVTLYHGDCREVMAGLPDESVHAIVTDPPYGLSFMGKRWDYDVPSVEVWQQCLRVLKPGGHLLAFAGTRTQHRMAVRIEDAGFEIRDMIAWVYGSGFPKSLDVSKAIDKAAGAEREVLGSYNAHRDNSIRKQHAYNGIADEGRSGLAGKKCGGLTPITAPATDDAKRWQGWGTALKPSWECITVARKPLCGTVAENVLTHGCGGLNVDGCRIGDTVETWPATRSYAPGQIQPGGMGETQATGKAPAGRWPANLIHDGSEEVTGLFPETDGGGTRNGKRSANHDGIGTFHERERDTNKHFDNDSGSAARFFYSAKADKADRGPGNNHPTVKPVDLMRYLVRLVCPMDRVVLDPFAGSGTTLQAAQAEGCLAIGVEREASYCEIITGRFHQRRLF